MKYMGFIEDLRYRTDEYNDSFNTEEENRYPKKQKELWAPINRNKAITQSSFGYDHENCLRLLAENGYDGEPVSSRKMNTARRWFEDSKDHNFPPQEDVLRMGIFFCLDFYTLLHWVLKADFEEFLIKGDEEFKVNVGESILAIIEKYNLNEKLIFQSKLKEFQKSLDKRTLYLLFEDHWHLASTEVLNFKNFSAVIDDFFKEDLIYYENYSEKITNFANYQKEIIRESQFGSNDDQETLWRYRGIWQTLTEDLDTIYIDIENTRLKNADVEQNYLKKFGALIIELTEQENDAKLNNERLSVVLRSPRYLSDEEIEKQVFETREKLKQDLADLKLKEASAKRNSLMDEWKSQGIPVSPEQLAKEKEQCKKEIRDIRKMIYPDVLIHDPVYAKLSKEQQEELKDILIEALKIDNSELGYPPNFVNHDMRSLEGLRNVRRRIEEILNMKNIQIDLRYEIQGETIYEKIAWLENEIVILKNRLNAAKGQLTAMLTDVGIQSKLALLNNQDKQEMFTEKMEKKIACLKEENVALKIKIEVENNKKK
ncbi:hypothetical protein Pelsub_P2123 [Pelolinea submarina]|uniref:Uncharacterized protein n=2 Tax=Pelolinea submarina TaxID=913107 RepID=A0A347ZUB1_9CHLR|nr:hypothetical protein DFR64_0382 [Pelolinea submarina]BBB48892.1 hypothetical protein Pelsub_P2123 [Pelolinea submarina]